MFSRLERERLQAMGLTVYQSVVSAPEASSATLAAKAESEFWQTRLGLNIRRYAEGIDTAALPASVTGAEGKKLVWNIIRSLRIGR
ncbi:hypothetical protein [Arenimonas sp.]|jgi:hypothetical protein|uniref:hypothetical protein n=1 Tax=Arenimonas sp. TaxID=1872635 RepID=UPI0037C02C9C